MKISFSDCNSLDMSTVLVEPKVNRIASEYIANNLNALTIGSIGKYGISKEDADALVQDVFISIYTAENDGEGFDEQYGYTHNVNKEPNLMNVEQFVNTRLKLYAKNDAYHSNTSESHRTSKENYIVVIPASSTPGEDEEMLDSFQKSFKNAPTVDSVAEVDDRESIREEIDFCIDVAELHGFKLINTLKNIDKILDLADGLGTKSINSVFGKLSEIADKNDIFASSLSSIFSFAKQYTDEFNSIICSLG